jgi:hypothetical protein
VAHPVESRKFPRNDDMCHTSEKLFIKKSGKMTLSSDIDRLTFTSKCETAQSFIAGIILTASQTQDYKVTNAA